MSDQTNKHPSDATDSNEDLTKDEDYDKARFNNRKTQKRRPPTPPTSVSGGATAGSHADVVAASNNLRQRILEILGNFMKCRVAGKSFSEALILASTNPQYDEIVHGDSQIIP